MLLFLLLHRTLQSNIEDTFPCVSCEFAECDTSGDTGDNLHTHLNNSFASSFDFPHIQVIYPTAPVR